MQVSFKEVSDAASDALLGAGVEQRNALRREA
jgi:hypothetical protein